MVNDFDKHIDFRKMILANIEPILQPLPFSPTVAFVWPTELCSIGCAHCNYSSPKYGSEERRLLAKSPLEIVKWVFEAGAKRFVICGGGEPLDEPEFVHEAVSACAISGLDFEIYTSGISFTNPFSIEQYIFLWKRSWETRMRDSQKFNIRLSVDAFHEELIGLQSLIEWIYLIDKHAPELNVAIRGLRVIGDESIYRLANLLNGKLERKSLNYGFITLLSGRKINIQWKGFVLEGRGQLRQLDRLNLSLPKNELDVLHPILDQWDKKKEVGRPFSLRHAVSFHRIDIEIRANEDVHILESQANDTCLKYSKSAWESLKMIYYRDPILHSLVENGLTDIATFIIEGQKLGVVKSEYAPFSINGIVDPVSLAWISAKAITKSNKRFKYSSRVYSLASGYLEMYK